jgi:hypothetical protein
MIDIETEQLLPLHDVPKLLPARPSGKKLHISAVYRWAQRGIQGIRLEVVRVGGTTYTSREALQRFVQSPNAAPAPLVLRTTVAQQRQAAQADRRIQEILHGKLGASNN